MEGINLQRAHLMINYDLPWNPNCLEQRFGRIHRIGQTEVCHLGIWSPLAPVKGTSMNGCCENWKRKARR
ncbi:MAG: SWF/SNF helicase family protein [Chloroflexi bacterium]|nr:SWF/SNF helicase family protein [Chloroflexota bacterium]